MVIGFQYRSTGNTDWVLIGVNMIELIGNTTVYKQYSENEWYRGFMMSALFQRTVSHLVDHLRDDGSTPPPPPLHPAPTTAPASHTMAVLPDAVSQPAARTSHSVAAPPAQGSQPASNPDPDCQLLRIDQL